MVFGDKKVFAIELDLDETFDGAWLFGKFCYWIKGVQVGDYELGTSLRDVLFQMKWVVHDCGSREGGDLCELIPQEAFSRLERFFIDGGEVNDVGKFQVPDTPARFKIHVPVDVFDGWSIYLIECGDKASILFKNDKDADVNVASIPTRIFDKVIKEAYDYIDKLYCRESGDCS